MMQFIKRNSFASHFVEGLTAIIERGLAEEPIKFFDFNFYFKY